MRRHLSALLLAMILLAPGVAVAQLSANEQKLYEGAKKEGEITWYSAHSAADVLELIGRGFEAKYPGLKVNVVRATAQVAFQRLSQDLKANSAQCDVFSSTDVGHYVYLKQNKLLAKYVPENARKIFPAYQNLDPDGFYHITSAGLVLITYNTAKVSAAEAPKKWTDLLDPKWRNQVSLGHPGFSGYVGTWAVLMKQLYGWDYFKKLEANKPQIGRSINDTVTMLNAGERSVAAGPAETTIRSAQKGNPLAVVYPEDGTLLMYAPSAIMANSKRPNGAKLFMEFLMGVEYSQIIVEQYGEPMRPEVKLPPELKPIDQIKTLRPTVDEIVNGVPEVKELWRDTFGV